MSYYTIISYVILDDVMKIWDDNLLLFTFLTRKLRKNLFWTNKKFVYLNIITNFCPKITSENIVPTTWKGFYSCKYWKTVLYRPCLEFRNSSVACQRVVDLCLAFHLLGLRHPKKILVCCVICISNSWHLFWHSNPLWLQSEIPTVHSAAFWQILVHWELDKPLLKIHGVLIKQKM